MKGYPKYLKENYHHFKMITDKKYITVFVGNEDCRIELMAFETMVPTTVRTATESTKEEFTAVFNKAKNKLYELVIKN